MNETKPENTDPLVNKVVRIGTIAPWEGARRRVSVYFHIQTRSPYNRYFSITGVIGPTRSGNAAGGCGQIDMEFAHRNPADNDTRYACGLIKPEDIKFAKGWDANLLYILLDVWKAWHLKEAAVVPPAVIAFCNALPDTDQNPAWV